MCYVILSSIDSMRLATESPQSLEDSARLNFTVLYLISFISSCYVGNAWNYLGELMGVFLLDFMNLFDGFTVFKEVLGVFRLPAIENIVIFFVLC